MTNPYRVLVTGSRDAQDPHPVNTALDQRLTRLQPGQRLVIIHGACQDRRGRLRGVDGHADAWARRAQQAGHPVDIEPHPAEDHGPWPRCGPIRNAHMVSLGADEALAFIGPCTSPRCRKPRPAPIPRRQQLRRPRRTGRHPRQEVHRVTTQPTPEQVAAFVAALQGQAPAIVCYSRCWPCQFDQHYDPPQPHPWADDEDRAHAKATGQPEPTSNCACHCAKTPDQKPHTPA